MPEIKSDTVPNARGSSDRIPKSKSGEPTSPAKAEASTWAIAAEPAKPRIVPVATSFAPCRRTSFRTSVRFAPSATRMPISRVR